MGTAAAGVEEMAPADGSVCSSGDARGDGAQVLFRRWEEAEEVRLGSTKL
jgi:predicted carbohydrate-binding protein with CBM5 and CBM33 domain